MIMKKGTLTLSMFSRIMLIFIVIGVVAMIWIYTAKIQELRTLTERNEKELVLWNTITGYKDLRSHNAFGDEEYVYDFYKLNRLNSYTTIDCKEIDYLIANNVISNNPAECIKLYPNKYFFRVSFDSIPFELSDDIATDYLRFSSGKCVDFLSKIYTKKNAECADEVDVDEIAECNADLVEIDGCIDGFNAYVGLGDTYTEGDRSTAEVLLYNDCIAFNKGDILDPADPMGVLYAEKEKMGYMFDVCKDMRDIVDDDIIEKNMEWSWGDVSVPLKYGDIIGIRFDGEMHIGLMEAGVELVE